MGGKAINRYSERIRELSPLSLALNPSANGTSATDSTQFTLYK